MSGKGQCGCVLKYVWNALYNTTLGQITVVAIALYRPTFALSLPSSDTTPRQPPTQITNLRRVLAGSLKAHPPNPNLSMMSM